MKAYFLPVGSSAASSLGTVFAALSCGASLPVSGLDTLLVTDGKPDSVIPALVGDLNHCCRLFSEKNGIPLFSSSFSYDTWRPDLPSAAELAAEESSACLLSALRGKGAPLSYKIDREAVEWALSALLEKSKEDLPDPFDSWFSRLRADIAAGEETRLTVLCDLCDPFSAGAAFACLRFLHAALPESANHTVALLALAKRFPAAAEMQTGFLRSALEAVENESLVKQPGTGTSCPADAMWLLSLPVSMVRNEDSWRLVYIAAARIIGSVSSARERPGFGLHTVSVPGILNLRSLGAQAADTAACLHASVWLLTDLLPSLRHYHEHPAAFRSFSPSSRTGFLKRLFRGETENLGVSLEIAERAVKALLAEVTSLIRSLPDEFRLSEQNNPLWQQAVDACGRTVTVASEYDVSVFEAEEAGIVGVKTVHRVSLADTDEERQLRRLNDIAQQLVDETKVRDGLLEKLGGCRAFLVLMDCRNRCAEALAAAESKAAAMALSPDGDKLRQAAQFRRVDLLKAAVSRCDDDLRAASSKGLGLKPSSASSDAAPWSGEILSSSAAEKLFTLLGAESGSEASLQKEIRELYPSLLTGFQLSDQKALFKKLLAAVPAEPAENPFSVFASGVFGVSLSECSSLPDLSSGMMPAVPLLPDLYPAEMPASVSAVLSLFPGSEDTAAVARKRALLAMLMLSQYRRRTANDPEFSTTRYRSGDSPLLNAWLGARHAESVWILSLSEVPFALILPKKEIIPARWTAAHTGAVPAFALPWLDQSAPGAFIDPCSVLSEGGRTILAGQLAEIETVLRKDDAPEESPDPLSAFLYSFRQDLSAGGFQSDKSTFRLALRLKGAFGLRLLPAFSPYLQRTVVCYERFIPSDTVAACLTGQKNFNPSSCSVSDDVIYSYRGKAFAREHSRSLLQPVCLPEEEYILSQLERECEILTGVSDDYRDALVREISLLLERCPDADPACRETAMRLLDEAGKPLPEGPTELSWPWDPLSPSVQTILSECLGERLASHAAAPFSDLLAYFPARGGEVIGDSLLSSLCVLEPSGSDSPEEGAAIIQDAVLPPLSPGFASALSRLPEGRVLLTPSFLSFGHTGSGSVRAEICLDGSFTLRLVRTYTEEETVYLYAHDIPTLAVWPSLPFPQDDWHTYFTYAHLPSSSAMRIFTETGEGSPSGTDGNRFVLQSASFPLCFAFFREDSSVGALPNILPAPDSVKHGTVTACIDFGSAGTSVVLSEGRDRRPLSGPVMVRTLLNNPSASQELLRKEFLPAVPVSALLPTSARLFRNVPGEAPVPFVDGIILMSSSLRDVLALPAGSVYTSLKWEEEKGRSVSLCLHQIMLMAALQARYEGAEYLTWRFAVPDGMAPAGRENLMNLFSSLSLQVNDEAGFSALPPKESAVAFAAESSAQGAYFRYCASEDTRGGFMVLDIGACTADISLFLRGREQALRTCQIPLGIHYMLLPALLARPESLEQDLGMLGDEALCQDLRRLTEILRASRSDPVSLRHSRIALDNFIADRFPLLPAALVCHPASGYPTRTGSVLLLHFSYLMMLSGLLLLEIASDPNKNDFLPEQMSLCLAGRGSLLLECLPDQVKTGLWHFLTMFRNQRVASLSLLFSSEKKMEIPVGLSMLQEVSASAPPASSVPSVISVRPEELLPQFLLRFRKEFPASFEILFPGFCTNDFYHPFTPLGESVISASISQSFTERTAQHPYDALSSWIINLLDLSGNPS